MVVYIDKKGQNCSKICFRFFSKNSVVFVLFCFRFFLGIFASKEWNKLELVESEYLKKLAVDLPGTLLYSKIKAERTVRTYATGWQGWKKWSQHKLGFSEIPANPLHIALYLQDLLNDAKKSVSLLLWLFQLFIVLDGIIKWLWLKTPLNI